MSPKITNKISLNKTLNNFPRKNFDTTFSQPLQWILCQGRLAKNLNFFFNNLPPGSQKNDRILQKKLLKHLF